MAWQHPPIYPYSIGSCPDVWEMRRQYYFAISERESVIRAAVVNPFDDLGKRWPRQNQHYYHGTVTGITASGIQDTAQTSENCWPHTFFNYSDIDFPLAPQYYSVFIDNQENEKKYVYADIIGPETGSSTTAHPNGTTLAISDISDTVPEKIVSSLSEFVGKDYWIVKRDGLSWVDRWPVWPNSFEIDRNTVQSSNNSSLATPNSRYANLSLASGQYDLLARGQLDGRTYRQEITSKGDNSLGWNPQTWYPASGSTFLILNHNGSGQIDRDVTVLGEAQNWHTGITEDWWSHDVKTSGHGNIGYIGRTGMISVPQWTTGVDCDDSSDNTEKDQDYWSAIDEECSEADHSYTPNYWKSLRSLQAELENISTSFVEAKEYEGWGDIPNFTKANFFFASEINCGKSVVNDKSPTNYSFTITETQYEGLTIFWTVLNSDGSIRLDSSDLSVPTAVVTDGVIDLGTGLYNEADELVDPDHENDVGKIVIYSAGWTRYHWRRFRYFYDKTCFLPDQDVGGVPIIPATSGDPGIWSTRNKSDHYQEVDDDGFQLYPDLTGESDAFTSGTLAMYAGDNFNDPSIDDQYSVTITRPDGMDQLTPYIDKYYTGRWPSEVQNIIDGRKSGVATSGSNFFLQDNGKSFWDGIYRTESGVATGGSTTTLQDTSKTGNGFWDSATGRWNGFVLNMTGGANSGYKRPITGMTGTTLTVSPAFPSAISAGQIYSIYEPQYELNQYKNRILKITNSSGYYSVRVNYNDNDTLFFNTQSFSVSPGMPWQILEEETGNTYLRSDSEWIKPSGVDPRGIANGREYPDDQKTIEPTILKGYGRIRKLDYIHFDLFDEMYDAINQLVWIQKDPRYDNLEYWHGFGTANINYDNFTNTDLTGTVIDNGNGGRTYPVTGSEDISKAWVNGPFNFLEDIEARRIAGTNGSYTIEKGEVNVTNNVISSGNFILGELSLRGSSSLPFPDIGENSIEAALNKASSGYLDVGENGLTQFFAVNRSVNSDPAPRAYITAYGRSKFDTGTETWSTYDCVALTERDKSHIVAPSGNRWFAHNIDFWIKTVKNDDTYGSNLYSKFSDDVTENFHQVDSVIVPLQQAKEKWSVIVGNTDEGGLPTVSSPTIPHYDLTYDSWVFIVEIDAFTFVWNFYGDFSSVPDDTAIVRAWVQLIDNSWVSAGVERHDDDGYWALTRENVGSDFKAPGPMKVEARGRNTLGYQSTDKTVVYRFDVTDGFLYVD